MFAEILKNEKKLPELRLHGISPIALAVPPNPPVAMFGQHSVTGGES